MRDENKETQAEKIRNMFPILGDREAVLAEINGNDKLRPWFKSLKNDEYRERFLDICSGARGLRMTYDGYFKHVFNTDIHRDRLEALISAILGQKVKIKEVLPQESLCVSSDKTLVIMDVVVELEDGSITNVEMQKHGYSFPGERAACYAADLLLRQYKRVRDTGRQGDGFKKKSIYKDIRPVYTIVFFEKSPKAFHEKEQQLNFLHHAECKSDTGVKVNLLQNFYFVPLDIFRSVYENKTVDTELAAWLMFLATDQPADICSLIEAYPYFKDLYRDVFELASDIEGVMKVFSKELQELDEGTTQYMIDELADENEELRHKVSELEGSYTELEGSYTELEGSYTELEDENTNLKSEIQRLQALLASKNV